MPGTLEVPGTLQTDFVKFTLKSCLEREGCHAEAAFGAEASRAGTQPGNASVVERRRNSAVNPLPGSNTGGVGRQTGERTDAG